jgi:hypothetical protein
MGEPDFEEELEESAYRELCDQILALRRYGPEEPEKTWPPDGILYFEPRGLVKYIMKKKKMLLRSSSRII